jgi:hypothetical protein
MSPDYDTLSSYYALSSDGKALALRFVTLLLRLEKASTLGSGEYARLL